MVMEIGKASYLTDHRNLAPRNKPQPFEVMATQGQLDVLNGLIRDNRIPAPLAYGVQQYMSRGQMTGELATKTLDVLLGYLKSPADEGAAKSPGIYVDPKTDAYYLIKRSQANRLYALDLSILSKGEKNPDGSWKSRPAFQWQYSDGSLKAKKIQESWRATPEQLKKWGDIWGTCIKCHSELSRQDSIERGMGKTCWEKQFK